MLARCRSTAASNYTSNGHITYGTCDVWSEFALSFRSLCTAVVYLSRREHREAFRWTKFLRRLRNKRISFGSVVEEVPLFVTGAHRPSRFTAADRSRLIFVRNTDSSESDSDSGDVTETDSDLHVGNDERAFSEALPSNLSSSEPAHSNLPVSEDRPSNEGSSDHSLESLPRHAAVYE